MIDDETIARLLDEHTDWASSLDEFAFARAIEAETLRRVKEVNDDR